MLRSRSAKKLTALLLFFVLFAGILLTSFITRRAALPARAASSLPYHEFANGPYKVSGNQIIDNDGTPYIFHGMGRDGLEFECTGDPALDSARLAFMGPGTSGSNGTYWWGNTVRLPLSEGFWLKGSAVQSCTATQYQALVKKVVDSLTALKLNVVIDLQWTDAGGTAGTDGGGAGFDMADTDSVTFWTQVATLYKGSSNVLFELYNEPHPSSWSCWAAACPITDTDTQPGITYTYQGVGLQALVNAVRATGATNVAIVAGMNWGYDFSQLASNPITDSGNNLAYDTHPYPYGGKLPADWDTSFGFLTATAPVMSLESGEYDCGTTYMSQLLSYFDARQMSWIGWAWYSTGSACGYPQVITDYQGTPAASMGTLEYDQLLGYANQPIPTPTPGPSPSPSPTPVPGLGGPVSSVWYFPEGRAGGGFKEWLTLENPNNTFCTVTIAYLAQPDGRPNYRKIVSVNVPANSRMTEWVDGDLGTSPTGPGISDAAQIIVNSTATPKCTGIVAERPMYFNALGTNSGSDVIGLTKLGTTFYFGDLAQGNQPGGGSYSSFITILNPLNGQTANVTATYYAGGNIITTQKITVNGGSRGTIVPTGVTSRSVVVVTSDQPIAVERPTYFRNINGGQAGIVSGGADVVGVQNLSNDWLFAEGYTAQQFQENLVIANVDPVNKPASVTIALESSTGGTPATYTLTVNPNSQVIWNVNNAQKNQALSAEVTSTGANILVEREMFFKYLHNANGRSLSSTGGSDVLGQLGPAASSNYGFAEGYVNVGYDEWLTIQNPTATTETINIAIVNEAGGYYATSISVPGHSRYTVDITGMVIRNLYRSGEGFAGYEVSMVVQSSGAFVAERPIYWNASGTQGGDDVIGYTGG
jgi:hypothetical protein